MKGKTRFLLPAIAALSLVVFVACSDSEGTASPAGRDASRAAANEGAGPMAGLTIEDIDARLHLSATQRDQMEDALDRLHRERRHVRGEGPRAMRGMEPPAIGFLETASKVLTPDQFASLARLAADRRDEFLRSGGPKRMREEILGGEEFGKRAARALDLTREQRRQIRSILDEKGGDLDRLHEQVRSGALSRDQAFDQAREIRTSTRDRVREVLTEEQRRKAESLRDERVGERVEWRLSHMDEHLDRRAEFLGRVLGLSADQTDQVHAMLKDSIPERKQVLESLRSGSIEPEQAAERILTIEKSIAQKIEPMLTPEQKDRWDAIRELLPEPVR